MNDFTKEELCALRDSRCYHMDDSYPSNDPLFNKLQFMIDNYRDPHCIHQVDKETKSCKLCGLPSHCIPCVGGWI